MRAKKIIDERKITKSLNHKALGYSLIGVFGDKLYLSNGCYALIVSINQIINGGRLWKMVEEALAFAGGHEKIVKENCDGEKSLIKDEDLHIYFDIFHRHYGWDNKAVYTGEIRNGLCIVKNRDGTERGFNSEYIDVIKNKAALLTGIFGKGKFAPLRYTEYNYDNYDIEVNYIVMPCVM